VPPRSPLLLAGSALWLDSPFWMDCRQYGSYPRPRSIFPFAGNTFKSLSLIGPVRTPRSVEGRKRTAYQVAGEDKKTMNCLSPP
jgi:hypothetical protein